MDHPIEPESKLNRLKSSSDKTSVDMHREYLDMDPEEEEYGRQETPELQEESSGEPDKPVFTPEELETLSKVTKSLVTLPNLKPTSWNDQCNEKIEEFFSDPSHTVLTIYFRKGKLKARLDYPMEMTDSGLVYFSREQYRVLQPDDFLSNVLYGTINDRVENSVLRIMEGFFAPIIFKNKKWPNVKRNSIFTHVYDFLTNLVDATYRPMGITILYLPWEGYNSIKNDDDDGDDDDEKKNCQSSKEDQKYAMDSLYFRMDRVVARWIRNIRQSLVVTPVHVTDDELHDVINEFEFWHAKFENLSGISKQLKDKRLRKIINQLAKVKSPNVRDLKLLRRKLKVFLKEAESNLKYLDIILGNCKTLDDPKEVQESLPKILHIVRFVWTESPYYYQMENIERLLCSISIYVVKVCVNSVNLKLIFDNPEKCQELIKTCLKCCAEYSQIYDNIISGCEECEQNWKVDKAALFNYVDAFEQRCYDVLGICEATFIYASSSKINFGGTRGSSHELAYSLIRDRFLRIIEKLRVSCSYSLDITKIKWFEDLMNFQTDLDNLENTMKNLLISIFEDVNSVEMMIETLYALLRFKNRKAFRAIIHNKWAQAWEMFNEEIKTCALVPCKYEAGLDKFKLLQSDEDTLLIIHKNYLNKLYEMLINATDWLSDCETQFKIPKKYQLKKTTTKVTSII